MRVLLADDHVLIRAGVRALLQGLPGIDAVDEASDGAEALGLIEENKPDIAFLDITMPGMSGIEVAERAARAGLHMVRIVILTMHDTEAHVVRALRAHVRGYLLKHAAATELGQCVETVMDGRRYLSPAIAKYARLEARRATTPWPSTIEVEALTPRQREVLQRLALGQSVKEIAFALSLSVKTVETHRAQLMARLQLRDLPSLVRFAIRAGLIGIED